MHRSRQYTFVGILVTGLLAGYGALDPAVASGTQERISFTAPDSGFVSAEVHGSGPRAVVLVHGGRYDRTSWTPQARVLADAGFRVIAIDLRGRGESHGGRAGPDSAHYDVLGAVDYLRRTGATSVAVVGASLGGWAAGEAVVAAKPGSIDRVVLLAHPAIDHPERLTGRKLFIVSRGDTTASGVPRLVAIRAQYDRAPEPKELVILEGTAHAQQVFQTNQGDRLLHEILRFLSAR